MLLQHHFLKGADHINDGSFGYDLSQYMQIFILSHNSLPELFATIRTVTLAVESVNIRDSPIVNGASIFLTPVFEALYIVPQALLSSSVLLAPIVFVSVGFGETFFL